MPFRESFVKVGLSGPLASPPDMTKPQGFPWGFDGGHAREHVVFA